MAVGADQYWLDVGSTLGAGDLSAGTTTSTSKTVTGLPCDGRTLYVQLYSHVNGAWLSAQRYTYTTAAATPYAQMISPAPQTTLVSASATFTWTATAGADSIGWTWAAVSGPAISRPAPPSAPPKL